MGPLMLRPMKRPMQSPLGSQSIVLLATMVMRAFTWVRVCCCQRNKHKPTILITDSYLGGPRSFVGATCTISECTPMKPIAIDY
ncbi:hypothetical protein BDV32DRAFT_128989 [Aspergillus pseudonomiae]|nr:hypothetical protein BDV32DRAFT_128989 [Aspergillus pseudonomiae]